MLCVEQVGTAGAPPQLPIDESQPLLELPQQGPEKHSL
jgi:hypothetical protein